MFLVRVLLLVIRDCLNQGDSLKIVRDKSMLFSSNTFRIKRRALT